MSGIAESSIEYDVTVDDLSAFSAFHLRGSDAGKRYVRRQVLVFVSVLLGISAVSSIVRRDPADLIGGIVLCLPVPFVARPLLERATRRYARRMYGSGGPHFGRHRLSITSDALVEEGGGSSLRTDLEGVGPIYETSDHVFIYVSPVIAHAIPRRALVEGDLNAFLSVLKERTALR